MLYADGELDDVRAAEVEAYLAEAPHDRAVVATIFELGALVRESADERAARAGADDVADWVMARIERDKVVPLRREQGPIWPVALGGLAAAAAVALLAWRFAGLDLTVPGKPEPSATAAAPHPDMVVASASVPSPDYDPEPEVSVDAIDFGARTGTIFYVPGDTGTTTVVWLSDDEAGDN